MLLRPREDFYQRANPTPADTLLVIETCDSSPRDDQEVRVSLCAAHGVPEVWLVDLVHRRLETFRDPAPDGDRQMLRPNLSQTLARRACASKSRRSGSRTPSTAYRSASSGYAALPRQPVATILTLSPRV